MARTLREGKRVVSTRDDGKRGCRDEPGVRDVAVLTEERDEFFVRDVCIRRESCQHI
jgi:hypothetical protein